MPPVAPRSPSCLRPRPALWVLGLALLTLVPVAIEPPAAAQDRPSDAASPETGGSRPPENGDTVWIAGQVTDARGTPVAGLPVIFEAFRSSFNLRRLERREKDFRRVETVSDEQGRFRLEWLWDDYFNRFRIGVAVHHAPDEAPRFLEQEDTGLGRRLETSGSAIVPLVIEDLELLDAIRRFEATLQTEDQRRIYRQLGYPDEVRTIELTAAREATWWYFHRGEVYRFADGRLQEVESFQPIKRF